MGYSGRNVRVPQADMEFLTEQREGRWIAAVVEYVSGPRE